MNLEDIYINELMKETEFKRLIELKKIIDKKYGMKIVAFKNKEALYLEAKENKYMDLDKARKEFQRVKVELYSYQEVKEYFELERKIQEMIASDMNELKKSISNKFLEHESISI